MKRISIPVILLLASAIFALAGAARDKNAKEPGDDRGVLAAIAQAPLASRDWRNPYEGQPDATPGELVWFLRNGNLRGGMPSWSGLPIERRWQLVTYLKSLRH
jgi:hypothetical protein